MPTERRNLTALGRKRRREFDRSLQKLRDLGMPDWAIEYYRRASRVAGLPPHMIVGHVAVIAAGRQMQNGLADKLAAESEAASEESADMPSRPEPSYQSVQTLRRRVTGLWRDIQRHGALTGTAEGAAGSDLGADEFARRTVTPLRPEAPAPGAKESRSRTS